MLQMKPTLPAGLDRAEYRDYPLDMTPEWYQLWFADLASKLRTEIVAGDYAEGTGDLALKIMRRYPDLYEAEICGALDEIL